MNLRYLFLLIVSIGGILSFTTKCIAGASSDWTSVEVPLLTIEFNEPNSSLRLIYRYTVNDHDYFLYKYTSTIEGQIESDMEWQKKINGLATIYYQTNSPGNATFDERESNGNTMHLVGALCLIPVA